MVLRLRAGGQVCRRCRIASRCGRAMDGQRRAGPRPGCRLAARRGGPGQARVLERRRDRRGPGVGAVRRVRAGRRTRPWSTWPARPTGAPARPGSSPASTRSRCCWPGPAARCRSRRKRPTTPVRGWPAGPGRRAAARTATDGKPKDAAAAARRAEQRAQRVAAGLADLQVWLGDQVRAGPGRGPGGRVRARGRDRRADGGRAGARRGQRAAPAVRDPGVRGRLARPAAGRVRAAAPAGPGAPAARHAARAAGRRGPVPGRLHHQPGGRAGQPRRSPTGGRYSRSATCWTARSRRRRIWLRGRDTGRFALLLSSRPPGTSPAASETAGSSRAWNSMLTCTSTRASRRCARWSGPRHGRPGGSGPPGWRGRRRRAAEHLVGRAGAGPVADRMAGAADRARRSAGRGRAGGWSTGRAGAAAARAGRPCGPCWPSRAATRSRWPASGARPGLPR